MKILFCALLMLPMTVTAQSFEWVKQIAGKSHKQTRAHIFDHSGNMVIGGHFFAKTDFDPGPETFTLDPLGDVDAFISKYDPNGNFIWAIQFGSETPIYTPTYLTHLVSDEAGNIYATGTLKNACDFDPGPDSFMVRTDGYIDIFIMKISPEGKLIWVKTIGGEEPDYPGGLVINASGSLYLAGGFCEASDLMPGPDTLIVNATGWKTDAFIMKLDTSGELQWLKYFGGPAHDNILSVALDSSSNVILGGRFGDTVDFDPGAGLDVRVAKGEYDMFVLKLNPEGKFFWVCTFGNTLQEVGVTVATDLAGNIYASGNFNESIDIDPGPITQTLHSDTTSLFFLKLNPIGDRIWSDKIEGCLMPEVYTWPLAVDKAGAVYTTGRFRDTLTFLKGKKRYDLYSVGDNDPFVCKYDTSGKFVWALQIDGRSYYDAARTLALDGAENVYITGYFDDTTFFGQSDDTLLATTKQYHDVFIAKIKQPGSATAEPLEERAFTVGISPNPFASTTNVLLQGGNTYHLTIRDVLGREFFSTDIASHDSSTITYELSAKALNLIQGIYYLTVSSNNEQMTRQLLFMD